MKKINIGLLGFGTVGQGTYKILTENKELIANRHNIEFNIKKILVSNVNKKRNVDVDASFLTTNADEIINDNDIDIVVELLGGIEPAYTYISNAIKNNKHIVTANKAVIANKSLELSALKNTYNKQIGVEACVAGGIPIINAITTALSGNEFISIKGILNGTTNYILTQMDEAGLDYKTALKQAQELGYAEADPTADVEGIDAANKLSILIELGFNKYVHPDNIDTIGISSITKKDIQKANKNNEKIKLIASVENNNGKLEYNVKPISLPNNHPLAMVKGAFNGIFVTGNAVGELMFQGAGAGSLPTGSAVVGDIIAIAKTI